MPVQSHAVSRKLSAAVRVLGFAVAVGSASWPCTGQVRLHWVCLTPIAGNSWRLPIKPRDIDRWCESSGGEGVLAHCPRYHLDGLH